MSKMGRGTLQHRILYLAKRSFKDEDEIKISRQTKAEGIYYYQICTTRSIQSQRCQDHGSWVTSSLSTPPISLWSFSEASLKNPSGNSPKSIKPHACEYQEWKMKERKPLCGNLNTLVRECLLGFTGLVPGMFGSHRVFSSV